MRPNKMLKKLRDGDVVFGTFVYIPDPSVVEMIGYSGLDFALIDMEHSSMDLENVENMIRAAEVSGVTSVVRVPDNNPKFILRVLEAGAQGIIVPHIFNAQEASDVVTAMKYPPRGRRGMGRQRTANYGHVDLHEYMEWANSEIMVGIMVEDAEAIDHVEEIAAVEGLDMIFVGPGDLSATMGVPGGYMLPEPQAAIKRSITAIRTKGNAAVGMPGYLESEVPKLVAQGVRFLTAPSSDKGVLMEGFRSSLKRIKESIEAFPA